MHERKAAVVVCMVMGWDGVQFETGEKVKDCMRVLKLKKQGARAWGCIMYVDGKTLEGSVSGISVAHTMTQRRWYLM